MIDNEGLQAWLKKHFAHQYQRFQFDLSMGDANVASASIKSLCNFLAHGVALLAAQDPDYLVQCAEVHQKLTRMAQNLETKPDGRQNLAYQSAMIAGAIIEMAMLAIKKLHKVD